MKSFPLLLAAVVLLAMSSLQAAEPIRIGIIGLDTSHAIAFTKLLNDPKAADDLAGCRVVVAYPHGSADIQSSVSRIPGYTAEMEKLGVKIVGSLPELLEQVDCVLLETNDGRPHLAQALEVFRARKPVFIDKPLAASLADCVAIFEAAAKHKTPVFSSSALRYGKDTLAVRGASLGKLTHARTTSPASIEKTHPDLFWYGIHGVESLFTALGAGCESVARREVDGKIEVTGAWSGGRTGVFLEGKGYSGEATGEKGTAPIGSLDGYRPLVVDIVRMFRTGQAPVDAQETLEIYAFMEAADESKRQGGASVPLAPLLEKARRQAAERLKELGE